jgi:hypothetical protein
MTKEFPRLIFLNWQECDKMEINQKGWSCTNNVEIENGNRYQVCFFDKGRLDFHLKYNAEDGNVSIP